MNQQAHSVTSACACFTRLVAPWQERELAKLLRYQGSCSSSRAAAKEHKRLWRPGWQVGASQAESEVLLAETRAADMLELELATELDFGGISTSQVPSTDFQV